MENILLQLRKEHGYTQQQLADMLEVSRQTINAIERGKFNPSVILAIKISRIFKQPIEAIFIYEEDE
ncbi:helix-turn-helix transcriptional regulator [Vallitalea okinawensis]|uniref:helix-turn-helix transcriptional regulator n=1 Tax=Vallitalea okinawensis TaxID=2078660 RepID=UPI000CFC9B26|nr:helix-turn-helix transcriptional regulator [Vallitalea okinawensis]